MDPKAPFDFRRHFPSLAFVVIAALLVGGIAGAVIFTGVYNIAADAPHTRPIYWVVDQLRDRSIAVRARRITAPADLGDPARVARGAGLYAEMCTSCHLAPGMRKTELSQGLYPQAPDLSRGAGDSPAEEFWVIKHGIKLTAMPAWGQTHSDPMIWDLVAFLRTLRSMSPEQYQAAVKSAPAGHDAMMREAPGMQMEHDGQSHQH